MQKRSSLMFRLIAVLSVLLIGGFAALLMTQATMFERFFQKQAAHAYEGKTLLLVPQMAGGVKWGKAASIEKAYTHMTRPGEGSTLAAVLVTDAGRKPLTHFESDEHPSIDLADFLARGVEEMGEANHVTFRKAAHVITVARIVDPKKGDTLGYGAVSWGIAAAARELADARFFALWLGVALAVAMTLVMLVVLHLFAFRPIRQLHAAMAALAEGDMERAVPCTGRRDEIGAMASAVLVFRDNARRVEELHRERAEADRAEAERKRERAVRREAEEHERQLEERRRVEEAHNAMVTQLSESFGEMVEAARRGDFSVRVATSFDDPVLNELATGLNMMAELVQNGLAETTQVLEAVGHYDLTRRIEGNFEGAFGALRDGVNRTIETLAGILTRLQQTASGVRTETDTLANGFGTLSARTQETAASLKGTIAAVELLETTIRRNAERAQDVTRRSQAAHDLAVDGGSVMSKATDAMDRIQEASTKIADIIGLIDSIAFQTNLLSLNASVEAARAGEAGRGFAVVASEVRTLAQSSADASAEIRAHINRSSDAVTDGVTHVKEAAERLSSIVSGVSELTPLVTEIAGNTSEQATKVSEMTSAVAQIDAATQKNAELVDTSHASLSATTQNIEAINDIATAFTIGAPRASRAA